MRAGTLILIAIAQIFGPAGTVSPAQAFDLNGAWTTDARVCAKMFERRGESLTFRRDSEIHGSGFIIEGKSISGRAAKCTIKARREEGEMIHLVAACATDIMLSDVQFSLKVVNENRVLRIFPGMEGIEVAYDRCAL